MSNPGTHLDSGAAREDSLPDSPGHRLAIIGWEDHRVEIEAAAAHQRGDKCTGRRSDYYIGVIGMPSSGELNRHQSGHLKARPRDPSTTKDYSDRTHPTDELRAWPLIPGILSDS